MKPGRFQLDVFKKPLNDFKNTISHRKDAKSAKVFSSESRAFLCVLCVFAVNNLFNQTFLDK
jgi:hypothetical protein